VAKAGSHPERFTMARAIQLVVAVSLAFWPRLFILGFVIFSWKLGDAFSSWIVWLSGFFLLPWTTITYAMMWAIQSDQVFGIEWVFVGLAFLLDLFTWSILRDV
jgi:hypothetical protein